MQATEQPQQVGTTRIFIPVLLLIITKLFKCLQRMTWFKKKKKSWSTHGFFNGSTLTFWAVKFSVVGDCLVLWFSSIPASYSLDASGISFLPVMPIKSDIAKCPWGGWGITLGWELLIYRMEHYIKKLLK